MKRALAEPTIREKEEVERERRNLIEKFQTASFSELCEMTARHAPQETLHQCLSEIYTKTSLASVGGSSRRSSVSSSNFDTTDVHTPKKNPPKQIYEEYFPELFTY